MTERCEDLALEVAIAYGNENRNDSELARLGGEFRQMAIDWCGISAKQTLEWMCDADTRADRVRRFSQLEGDYEVGCAGIRADVNDPLEFLD